MTFQAKPQNAVLGASKPLLFVVLLVTVLFFGRELMIPLVAAAFFAMLMAPISGWMEKWIKRPFAVIICVLILLVAMVAIFAVVAGEINSFTNDLPAMEKKGNETLRSLEHFIQNQFGIEPDRQEAMVKEQMKSVAHSAGSYLAPFLGGLSGVLGGLVITLVYTFLLLYHRERYETFFTRLFGKEYPDKTKKIIENVTLVGQQYITGRTISITLLALFYASGFLVVGLKSAVLLGCIAALLSVIPYVGGIIGGIFPFFMAMATGDSSGTAMGVVVVIVLAHGLSTYIIEPLVVGGQMKLSALSMILFIIAGGILWGIAGMILFVPLLAMVKILCDNIEELNPYGYLISDPDEGKPSAIKEWVSNAWRGLLPVRKKKHP